MCIPLQYCKAIAHLNNPGLCHLKIINLFTSAKSLFPNNINNHKFQGFAFIFRI